VTVKNTILKNVRELGGGLGDLGTLLPLAILLIVNNGLSPVAVFLFVGLHYLVTGLYFRIPLPVQPLKAMAVIALATGATAQQIGATGIWMGVILLLLAATDLAGLLSRIFTKPIVRGIQLAVGLFLVQKGLELITTPPVVFLAVPSVESSPWLAIGLAAISGLIVLGLSMQHRVPATLVLLPLGILAGLFMVPAESMPAMGEGLTIPTPLIPTWNDFATALFLMVIPQAPLTFGNAVVSTCHVSRDYFGDRAQRVTPRSVCTSLGIGNLIGGLFGALPCCHGAGGLTAHYRFGARTGRATILMGALFVFVGLLFGDSVHGLFALIPPAMLGALLVYVGIEHCMMLGDVLPHRRAAFLALLIGGIALGTHNIATGFTVGMVVGLLMKRFPSMMAENAKL